MIPEERRQVYKELLEWSCNTDSDQCLDLGENIWAIKTKFGIGLTLAGSYDEAYDLYLDNFYSTIKPKRPKGKWIDDNCSECGHYVYHGDCRNFCPNCGAEMEGEEE